MNYWDKKNIRAEKAKKHAREMNEKYWSYIERSYENTELIDTPKELCTHNPKLIAIETDSVSAVLNAEGKTCVLNFASFKNPGGMFIEGSSAQEESLCHESTLYNVLEQKLSYYNENKKMLNRSMYKDRMLYSPDILFIRDGEQKLADVITCAAPNFKAADRYKMVTYEENLKTLEERVKFIISNLEGRELDTVILGAWGCGVFGQDPAVVADLFKKYSKYIDAKIVVFAVIGDDNFREFKRVCE